MNLLHLVALVAVGVVAGVVIATRPRPLPAAVVNRVERYYGRSSN